MRTTLILLCSCLLVCGQGFVRTAAFQGAARVKQATSSPEPDFSLYPGYLVDYNVNSLGLSVGDPISSMTDQGPNKWHGLSDTTHRPYFTNSVSEGNGKAFCVFPTNGTAYLQTNFTTTIAQPSTLYWVGPYPTTNGSVFFVDQGAQNVARTYIFTDGNNLSFSAGGNVPVSLVRFVSWKNYVWEMHWTNSTVFPLTNGVSTGSGATACGVNGIQGLTIGARYNLASSAGAKFYRFLWYSTNITNSNGTYGFGGTGDASNIVYNLKTLYGL